ncbi:MAG: outer membrane beta-barrel protein [Chthoniobacterales bacterium]
MKKLTLTLVAVAAVASAAFAGETYSGKEMKQVQQAPCPSWYADNEWNVGISGIYGANVGSNDNNNFFFNDSWDDGFGGSLDVKYFFRRYFGVGIEGFALSVDRNDNNRVFRNNNGNDFSGGVLGTFTFRYPIPCSRFAPYAFLGAGGYFQGNSNNNRFFNRNDNNGKFMGQFGAGFEVRFTPHIGWTNDVSYNDVEGGDNDFIMVRTGLNFAF